MAATRLARGTIALKKVNATKKNRKKNQDGNFNPRGENRRGQTNPSNAITQCAHMRTSHANTKTSVLYNENSLPRLTAQQIQTLKEELVKSETYRTPHRVLSRTATGTPNLIATPEGDQLELRSKNNVAAFFSKAHLTPSDTSIVKETIYPNRLARKAAELLALDAEDMTDVSPTTTQAVKKNNQQIKINEVVVTPELLKKAANEKRKNGGRRAESTASAMKEDGYNEKEASANLYARSFDQFKPDIKCEWLHLIADFIIGSKGRDKNLGCGTYHANTHMLFAESQVPRLAKAYPEGFHLHVKAEFDPPESQCLKTIYYTITTKDFVLPFIFNACEYEKPHIAFKEYVDDLILAMLEDKENVSSSTLMDVDTSQSLSELHPSLFYSKNQKATAATAIPSSAPAKAVR